MDASNNLVRCSPGRKCQVLQCEGLVVTPKLVCKSAIFNYPPGPVTAAAATDLWKATKNVASEAYW